METCPELVPLGLVIVIGPAFSSEPLAQPERAAARATAGNKSQLPKENVQLCLDSLLPKLQDKPASHSLVRAPQERGASVSDASGNFMDKYGTGEVCIEFFPVSSFESAVSGRTGTLRTSVRNALTDSTNSGRSLRRCERKHRFEKSIPLRGQGGVRGRKRH